MQVWPVGTTDFNIRDTSGVQQFHIGTNQKGQAIAKSSVPGNMPLRFYSVEDGLCELFGPSDDWDPGPTTSSPRCSTGWQQR